jgi:guanylate kinase
MTHEAKHNTTVMFVHPLIYYDKSINVTGRKERRKERNGKVY